MITRYKSIADKRKAAVKSVVDRTRRANRLVVRRSSKYIYAQMVSTANGETLFGVKGNNAVEVGKALANKAKAAKITKVVFDRGSLRYHGNVKLLADAAREAGLEF